SKPLTSVAVTQILRNLPPGNWSPFVDSNLPATEAAPVTAGDHSASGNSTARGLQSNVGQTNTQIAVCQDPLGCTAVNDATISQSFSDLATNPATGEDGSPNKPNGPGGPGTSGGGPGGTLSESGFAGINATPTPRPTNSSNSSDWETSW